MSLKPKIIIITGGAGGIGKHAAEKFSKEGNRVIVWDLIEEDLWLKVKEAFSSQDLIELNRVDIRNFEAVKSAAEKLFTKYEKVDVLINNAGVMKDLSVPELSATKWANAVDINITGTNNCIKALAPFMVQNTFGRIVNVASMAGMFTDFGKANYEASRSGILAITKIWSRELAAKGVTVNTIIPGFIETEETYTLPKNLIETAKRLVPVGRLGTPKDILHVYGFLLSEEASYVTGTNIHVDGGYWS